MLPSIHLKSVRLAPIPPEGVLDKIHQRQGPCHQPSRFPSAPHPTVLTAHFLDQHPGVMGLLSSQLCFPGNHATGRNGAARDFLCSGMQGAGPQASLQIIHPINKHCFLCGLENARIPDLHRHARGSLSAASCKFLPSFQSLLWLPRQSVPCTPTRLPLPSLENSEDLHFSIPSRLGSMLVAGLCLRPQKSFLGIVTSCSTPKSASYPNLSSSNKYLS